MDGGEKNTVVDVVRSDLFTLLTVSQRLDEMTLRSPQEPMRQWSPPRSALENLREKNDSFFRPKSRESVHSRSSALEDANLTASRGSTAHAHTSSVVNQSLFASSPPASRPNTRGGDRSMQRRPSSRLGTPSRDGLASGGIALNSTGGILITDEELERAFHLLDPEGKGNITPHQLKQRLAVLDMHISLREARTLLYGEKRQPKSRTKGGFFPELVKRQTTDEPQEEPHFGFTDLAELLQNNEVKGLDPFREACLLIDSTGQRFIEAATIARLVERLGVGALSEEDYDIIWEALGRNEGAVDGRITYREFRDFGRRKVPERNRASLYLQRGDAQRAWITEKRVLKAWNPPPVSLTSDSYAPTNGRPSDNGPPTTDPQEPMSDSKSNATVAQGGKEQ